MNEKELIAQRLQFEGPTMGLREASEEELERMVKRRNKYNVSPKEDRTADGIVFHSKKECERYLYLETLRRAGAVKWFLRQVPFPISKPRDGKPPMKYYADFLVFWQDGQVTIEDVKGMRTPTYKMKKRLVEERYPIRIDEV